MGYSKEIYEKADSIMSQRRMSAEKELDIRRNKLYRLAPRAREIETQLAATATKVGRAIIAGSNVREELLKLKKANLDLQQELNDILLKNNLPKDYLDEKYTCDACEDRGNIDGITCTCYKELLKELACEKLNSLSPLKVSSFDTINLDYQSNVSQGNENSPREQLNNIIKHCRAYAENFSKSSPNLFLHGDTGLGKTHISLAIAGVVTNNGFGVVYCSAPNILSRIERAHFSRNENEEEILEPLRKCDLLIIDDLGTEFTTQFTSATIYNLINDRILSGKPFIINTNLTFQDLNKIYTPRITSRIVGSCERLLFKGKDVRFRNK